jgi:hypothetical protein
MDLFKFPFHADVWGTASEWAMILVTSITAIFLYRTLKSQQVVQKAQIKLLEIEQLRLKEDYKPALRYSIYQDGKIPKTAGQTLISIAVTNNSDNPALKIRLLSYSSEFLSTGIPHEQDVISKEVFMSIHFIANSRYNTMASIIFDFKLSYEDLAGTKYHQKVSCFHKIPNDFNLVPEIPELID